MSVKCSNSNCNQQATKSCAKCKTKTNLYCSRDCQQADWKLHKKTCNQPSAATISIENDTNKFSGYIKASQHGSVHLTKTSKFPGVCTDGLSACIALIFHSKLTGNISLSHTPLSLSATSLIREAKWTGPDARLTIVPGFMYADPIQRRQYEFDSYFIPHVFKSLMGVCEEIVVDERVAMTGAVACAWDTNGAMQLNISVPSKAQFPLRIGTGTKSQKNCETLLLNGAFDVLLSSLDLYVEHDGRSWTGCASLNDSASLAVKTIKKGGKLDCDFFRKCVWNREDDGMNAENCSPLELAMAGFDLTNKVRNYCQMYV